MELLYTIGVIAGFYVMVCLFIIVVIIKKYGK